MRFDTLSALHLDFWRATRTPSVRPGLSCLDPRETATELYTLFVPHAQPVVDGVVASSFVLDYDPWQGHVAATMLYPFALLLGFNKSAPTTTLWAQVNGLDMASAQRARWPSTYALCPWADLLVEAVMLSADMETLGVPLKLIGLSGAAAAAVAWGVIAGRRWPWACCSS